ncbi:MAG: N-acetyltransferase [Candidatus Kapabacteria bacterium]|jgi:predicted N-acetyltransferase YhbS|nr:N-acetyltransferase [Candidatus Kapabacteria bacterium]
MEIKIRQENRDDFYAVSEVNKLAFGQDTEANLVDLLRNSNAFISELSFVATLDDKIIGYILFTKITIINDDKTETESLALAPMAVRPDFQNKGIGGQLINHGLKIAKELRYKSVIVLGHKDYYPKFGFEPTMKWNIKSPFEISDKGAFMGIELVTDGLKNASGLVKYPNEFETV